MVDNLSRKQVPGATPRVRLLYLPLVTVTSE